MRKIPFYTILLSIFMLASCMKEEPVKLLMGGSGWNKIVIIDKDTKKIEWEHPLESGWECNSVDCTTDGNILFSYRRGAKVVTKDHKEVWNVDAPEGCEMQTARVLPDGNMLLAWAGTPAVVMEVDKNGKELNRVEYSTGISNHHNQFRQVNKHKNGNYLIPIIPSGEIIELSKDGEVVKKHNVGSKPYTLIHLEKDVYWVAGGDAHTLLKYDMESGKTLKQYNEKDIAGTQLYYVAGLCNSERGGLYVTNWQGHDENAILTKSPQVFELDNDGKIIWSLNDNKTFGMISAISIMK